MLPPGLESPREVTLYYDSVYDSLIKSGQGVPFVYPWAGVGAFLTFGYLLIDHRQSRTLRGLRYPVFGFLSAFQIWCILTNKAKHPAGAFGVGLISAWGLLWVASFLVFNDCQSDSARIERYCNDRDGKRISSVETSKMNGSVLVHNDLDGAADSDDLKSTTGPANSTLTWQGFPTTFRNRLDWVADVFCNFRGVGWSWQISVIPPLPKQIEAQLHSSIDHASSEDVTISRAGIRRFSDRTKLLKYTIKKLIIGYLALDIIITLMHRDPYFWGYTDAAPPEYLPRFITRSFILSKYYRLTLGLIGLYAALFQAFALGPFFFCGLLGSDLIGVRGEPWMNPPDMFGSYSNVFDHGLAGWWGSWWHQTFRFGFEAASGALLDILNIDKRSEKGKTVSLFVAFFLSGCLHAAGSYTQLGDTRPLMGPMRFFLLQPFGILLQIFLTKQLSKVGVRQRTPKLLRQFANFVYVHMWGYFTAPLLLDDFAQGGNFLFEPIAFSPLRAMGLGAKDDTWFCWWNGILFWRSGKTWWDTGIAV